jgi:hypothetical protein
VVGGKGAIIRDCRGRRKERRREKKKRKRKKVREREENGEGRCNQFDIWTVWKKEIGTVS